MPIYVIGRHPYLFLNHILMPPRRLHILAISLNLDDLLHSTDFLESSRNRLQPPQSLRPPLRPEPGIRNLSFYGEKKKNRARHPTSRTPLIPAPLGRVDGTILPYEMVANQGFCHRWLLLARPPRPGASVSLPFGGHGRLARRSLGEGGPARRRLNIDVLSAALKGVRVLSRVEGPFGLLAMTGFGLVFDLGGHGRPPPALRHGRRIAGFNGVWGVPRRRGVQRGAASGAPRPGQLERDRSRKSMRVGRSIPPLRKWMRMI